MTWAFSLAPDSRHVLFQSHGNVDDDVRAFLFDVKFTPMSITGIYSGGIEQMMYQNDWQAYFPSSDDLLESKGPRRQEAGGRRQQEAGGSRRQEREGGTDNLQRYFTMMSDAFVFVFQGPKDYGCIEEDFRCSKLPCFTSFSHSWMIFPNEWSYPVSAVIDDKTSQGVYSFFELSEDGLAKVSSLEMISSAISIYTNLVGILNSHRGKRLLSNWNILADKQQVCEARSGEGGVRMMVLQALLLSGSRYIHEQRVLHLYEFYASLLERTGEIFSRWEKASRIDKTKSQAGRQW
eukprot:766795-Hanusia_phi.AAC.2